MATTMLLVRKSLFLSFLIASCKGRSSNAKDFSFDDNAYFDNGEDNISERRSMMDDLPRHIVDVGADSLWEQGIQGAGIVVGVMGTGVTVQHEALADNYLGRKADGTLDHTYSWFEGTTVLSPLPFPHDEQQFGTYLTSIIVGNKNNVGVAPKAKFISCKYTDPIGKDPVEGTRICLEWFLRPGFYTINDQGEVQLNAQFDASLSVVPDVVLVKGCNSCDDDDYILKETIDALFEAGVLVVSPSGQPLQENFQCSSIDDPPSIYDNVLTVAALDTTGSIVDSALGPAMVNGAPAEYIKPDGTAYGEDVNGAVYSNGASFYFPGSGSGVAAAVATGSVALLLEALPCLRRKPGKVIELLHKSMEPVEVDPALPLESCFSTQAYPNNVYGYGKINIPRAIETFLTSDDFKADRKKCGKMGKKGGKKNKKEGKSGGGL